MLSVRPTNRNRWRSDAPPTSSPWGAFNATSIDTNDLFVSYVDDPQITYALRISSASWPKIPNPYALPHAGIPYCNLPPIVVGHSRPDLSRLQRLCRSRRAACD